MHTLIYVSQGAQSALDERMYRNLCTGRYSRSVNPTKKHTLFELCRDWMDYIQRDIAWIERYGLEKSDCLPYGRDLYKVWLDESKTYAIIQYINGPNNGKAIYVIDFKFTKMTRPAFYGGNVILVCNKNYDLDVLSEFHSWMHRLDEVKGARPTFWC